MCRTLWLSCAFWHIPVSKSVISFAQCLCWNEPGHSGNYVFDTTKHFSSAQLLVFFKHVLFLRYLFCIPFI